MTAGQRAIPDACNAALRTIQPDEYQMDLMPTGFGLAHHVDSSLPGMSCLDGEAHALVQIGWRALQHFSRCGSSRGEKIGRVHASGQYIGVGNRSRPSKWTACASVDFADPFGPAEIVRAGTLLYAACSVNSRKIS
jgi:hypothetical protein